MVLLFLSIVLLQSGGPEPLLEGMQKRFAAANAVSAAFVQTYRAPGIEQRESGVMWVKKPGLMRWEYREPEKKLFVADGRQAYLYLPEDRQVQVRNLSVKDLRETPLRFLLGQGDILRSYRASEEPGDGRAGPGGVLIRLTPVLRASDFNYLVVEIERADYSLNRIVISERGGGRSEFRFSQVEMNPRLDPKAFEFKIPKGVDVVRLDEKE